jgi:peptidoglycan hydrolase CwlO-like protein
MKFDKKMYSVCLVLFIIIVTLTIFYYKNSENYENFSNKEDITSNSYTMPQYDSYIISTNNEDKILLLKQEIDNLNNSSNDLQKDITSNNKNITSHKKNMTDFKNKLDNLHNKINKINKKQDDLYNYIYESERTKKYGLGYGGQQFNKNDSDSDSQYFNKKGFSR